MSLYYWNKLFYKDRNIQNENVLQTFRAWTQFVNLHIQAKLWFRSNCFCLEGFDLKSKCKRCYIQGALLSSAYLKKPATPILHKWMRISKYFLIIDVILCMQNLGWNTGIIWLNICRILPFLQILKAFLLSICALQQGITSKGHIIERNAPSQDCDSICKNVWCTISLVFNWFLLSFRERLNLKCNASVFVTAMHC